MTLPLERPWPRIAPRLILSVAIGLPKGTKQLLNPVALADDLAYFASRVDPRRLRAARVKDRATNSAPPKQIGRKRNAIAVTERNVEDPNGKWPRVAQRFRARGGCRDLVALGCEQPCNSPPYNIMVLDQEHSTCPTLHGAHYVVAGCGKPRKLGPGCRPRTGKLSLLA